MSQSVSLKRIELLLRHFLAGRNDTLGTTDLPDITGGVVTFHAGLHRQQPRMAPPSRRSPPAPSRSLRHLSLPPTHTPLAGARLAKSPSDQRINLAPAVRKGNYVACTAPAGVAVALDVKGELARALTTKARLATIGTYFDAAARAAGLPAQDVQDVTVSVHTHAARRHTLVLGFAAQTHAAARGAAARLSPTFAQWQQPGGGSLAERLGVTASDDMTPRVAALPEFWYARVLRCLRFRTGATGAANDLLLVTWLTDRDWLADVPRAPGQGPNATQYEYATFPSVLPRGSAMRPLANGYHLDLVPVSAEASRAKGGVWVALADVALHHRVHMVPPFEHWAACGPRQPTVFKLNTHAWL